MSIDDAGGRRQRLAVQFGQFFGDVRLGKDLLGQRDAPPPRPQVKCILKSAKSPSCLKLNCSIDIKGRICAWLRLPLKTEQKV
jgi:hypothetical protein